jgi:hypothetical protein
MIHLHCELADARLAIRCDFEATGSHGSLKKARENFLCDADADGDAGDVETLGLAHGLEEVGMRVCGEEGV